MTRDDIIQAYKSGRRDFTELDLDDDFLDLSDIELVDIDFSRSFLDASFDNSDLRNARFEYANIKTCSFAKSNLTEASFRKALICAADFSGAIVDRTSFSKASIHGCEFSDEDLPRIDLPPRSKV